MIFAAVGEMWHYLPARDDDLRLSSIPYGFLHLDMIRNGIVYELLARSGATI